MILPLCYLVCASSANLLAAKRVTTSTVASIEEREITMDDLSGLLISIEKWMVDFAALQNNRSLFYVNKLHTQYPEEEKHAALEFAERHSDVTLMNSHSTNIAE